MGYGERRERVVVVSHDDEGTITDCLDGVAAHCPPDIEVVVVDRSSDDGTPDVAIRHPRVDQVVVVPAGRAQLVLDAAGRRASQIFLIGADTRPEPTWWDGARTALDGVPVVLGPDECWPNLAIDLTRLRNIHLAGDGDDVAEIVRRARVAGVCTGVSETMRVVPADTSPQLADRLPVRPAPAADARRYEATVSVVVCTRDRPLHLARCLRSIARLDDADHEVIVVDNDPVPAVDPTVLPAGARLVHEPRAGLDAARNRGMLEATGDVVAYVDDDCEVDPHWVTALRMSFADPVVGLVTGRVRPASLAGPTQQYFETHFGFDRGLERRRFTPWDDRPWYPLWTGALGTGCNMAIRRDELLAVGGFDELLDVGSTIGGGGDLDLYARLLDRGTVAEYAPDALVWHHHRDNHDALRAQFLGYGQAGGAHLMKALLDRPGQRHAAVRFFADRLAQRLRLARDIGNGSYPLPKRLLATEVCGFLSGPFLLLRARRRTRPC